MELNPDCIRKILLAVEAKCSVGVYIRLPDEKDPLLSSCFDEEILYHVRQCKLSGLLYNVHAVSGNGKLTYVIEDLTPDGHKFLANIRSETVWNNVKGVAEKVGSKSLDAIVQISSNVITQIIKSQFGLT